MLSIRAIKKLFEALNEELKKEGVIGEVGICGGAVMYLVFNAREATKDVDAIFRPTREIRGASKRVARRMHVSDDWLNDTAKGYFLSDPPHVAVLDYSNLRVWAPTAPYMLAMKCLSARIDSHDAGDVRFLVAHLNLTSPEQVFAILETYCTRKQIPARTQFFVEELFEGES